MKTILTVIFALLVSAASARAGGFNDAVQVRIITDGGKTLPTYQVKRRAGLEKVYAEAVKGDHYRIEVTNRLNRRVGLVIAVDGRNIISGAKSWLKNNERMYVLEPYASGEFAGWRTNRDTINRFYFTDVPDSYAAAFGDSSAMGVIAVAAYPEQRRHELPAPIAQTPPYYNRSHEGRASGNADKSGTAPAASSPHDNSKAKKSAKTEQAMESAGTGYGRGEYSPSRTVTFKPEKRPAHTVYIKYEWRSTLCRMEVINCDRPYQRPHNRMWDNSGYAPPPPGR